MKNATIQEEQYIIDESQEFTVGENPLIQKIFTAFPALKYRNYQLYFIGQLVSLTGTWLQTVAQGWLVLQLTSSAFWVGAVAAINALPVLFFSLFGGVIVDRFSKKKILLFTQMSSFIIIFILGLLTIFEIIALWQIIILVFLLGIVMAIDMPARQAFAIEMVGKEGLTSAIALNAGIFNGARVIGPGLAGFVIAAVGTGGAFMLNAFSFLAVVAALFFMRIKVEIPKTHPHPLKAIKEGVIYTYSHPAISTLMMLVAVLAIFGWSYITLMPVIAEKVFHVGATELGYMFSVAGLGAIVSTIIVSLFSKKVNIINFIFLGNIIFSVSIFFFSFTSSFYIALIFLFFSGLGIVMQFATMNSVIQHMVEDRVRGRVMSIFTLMFLGMTPFGSFLMGIIAEHLGSLVAVRIGSIIVLLFGIFVFTKRHKIEKTYTAYLKTLK